MHTPQAVAVQDTSPADKSVANAVSGKGKMAFSKAGGPPVVQMKKIGEHLDDVKAYAEKAKLWEETYKNDFLLLKNMIEEFILDARKNRKLLEGFRPEYFLLEIKGIVSKDGVFNEKTDNDKWKEYISAIGQSGLFSKLTLDVYNFCLGYEKERPGGGGLKTLAYSEDVEGNLILTGRPEFAKQTVELMKVKPRQHRRHVIAWHNIRDFTNKAKQQLGDDMAPMLTKVLDGLKGIKMYDDIKARVDKLGYEEADKQLMVAVFIMNSNPSNLWVGSGKENSEINLASIYIRDRILECKTFDELFTCIDGWHKVTGTPTINEIVRKRTFDLVIFNLKGYPVGKEGSTKDKARFNSAELLPYYYGILKGEKDTYTESQLKAIIGKIEEYIRSNLEFDVGFNEKDSVEALKKKSVGAIPLFYKMLFGDGKLKPGEIQQVFETMLTLPKSVGGKEEDPAEMQDVPASDQRDDHEKDMSDEDEDAAM